MTIESVDLFQIEFTPDLLRAIPPQIVRKYNVLPIYRHDGGLTIVQPNLEPDYDLLDALMLCPGVNQLDVRHADPWVLAWFIHKLYGAKKDQEDLNLPPYYL